MPTSIDREAIEVILDALRRWPATPANVRMMQEQYAAGVASLKMTKAEIATAERTARSRERRARRRRGELKAKRGNYPRSRGLNDFAAREMLPYILRTLRGYFRVHNPTVPVTRTWAIKLTALCCEIDEDNFRNFLKKGRRPS